jgi:ABC-type polysaccharide/polyol phosphate transport system ATPase subunit
MARLIAGITLPTEGKVTIRGKVVPLLSVGGCLSYLLTVKENIYLLFSFFGLEKSSRDGIYDKIISFSGLEDYIDTPIKNLSSGMSQRMVLSTVLHLPHEGILIDESLASCDYSFQEKVLERIQLFKRGGSTMVLISHNKEHVQTLCRRVIWVEEGKIKADGPCQEVVDLYLRAKTA